MRLKMINVEDQLEILKSGDLLSKLKISSKPTRMVILVENINGIFQNVLINEAKKYCGGKTSKIIHEQANPGM